LLPVERHDAILDAVRAAKVISTDALVRDLGVSAETVRRDLLLLEDRGVLRRVHGGAASVERADDEPSFSERSALRHQAKREVAQIAVGLLEHGQTVVIDSGTTAVEVARAIPQTFRGTIATPSLRVATEVADRPGVEVLVSGGRLRRGDLTCSNAHAKAMFAHLHPDVAFLCAGGVDAEVGVTDYYLDEIDVRKVIIANTARSFVLADSSKLGHVAPYGVCGLDAVSGIITEAMTSPTVGRALEVAGVVVLSP
jgi:DeoR family transcriptional regulator, fructose operon transcriptional repressor